MATDSLSSESFKLPSEPCPLPSLGSDEESFVVLWKDMDSRSIVELKHEPIGTGIVEEAKQLIHKELNEIEQLSLAEKAKTQTDSSLFVDGPSGETENKTEESVQMEKSTALPKMPQVERGFDASEVISITTLSTDLTSEQVQKKVSEIVDENIRLKDTILQNNMSMKSQYERIVAWQEDVQKVHHAHKEKIIEAKEFIERLKKENYNLIRELEQVKASKDAQEQELNSLKQSLGEKRRDVENSIQRLTGDNLNQFELDAANKKLGELELAVKNLTLENDLLKKDNAKLAETNSKVVEYEKETNELRAALNVTKIQLDEAKSEVVRVKSSDEEKLKSLNEVVDSLRSQLFFTNQQKTMLPTLEEVANIRQQLANTQVVLTQVELSKKEAQAQIEKQNKEILELRAQLGGSRGQSDEIYALKAQLDLYKADFEAERSAKETIKGEKERLSEDMQNLQRRNQQLQEEIDLIRENDFVVPAPQRREQVTVASAPPSSSDHPMKCPVCNFGFKTHQALENHVYRCIELDDHLP